MTVPVDYDDPASTRAAITEALEVGFPHVVLTPPAPYPGNVASELIDAATRPRPATYA